jgi:TRAP-type C4-dicarboxylate transport system permease small subunit
MKILRAVIQIFNIIAILAVLAMVVLVLADVITRYIFKSPIVGAYELVQMLMVCIVPSMGVCLLEKRHIWVDLITAKLSRTGQLVVDILTLGASVIILGLLTWQSYNGILSSIAKNTTYTLLKIPQWPFRAIFFIGMLITFIASIVFMAERISCYRNGGMPKDLRDDEIAVMEAEKYAERS